MIGGAAKDTQNNVTAYFGQYLGGVDSVNASTVEAEAQSPIPLGGTISKLYIRLNAAAGPGATSYTFTVRKNGADTGVTCTATGAATSCTDLTNNAVFVAGDLLSISVVPSATDPTDHLDVRWAAVFTPN
jgi:hypothetical protein